MIPVVNLAVQKSTEQRLSLVQKSTEQRLSFVKQARKVRMTTFTPVSAMSLSIKYTSVRQN